MSNTEGLAIHIHPLEKENHTMTTPIKKLMLAAFAATAICLGAKADTIDLSLLTANYTAQDGDVLTGETSCLVTIADGAIVTLAGVTINRLDAQPSMTCVGNATVLLADGTMYFRGQAPRKPDFSAFLGEIKNKGSVMWWYNIR